MKKILILFLVTIILQGLVFCDLLDQKCYKEKEVEDMGFDLVSPPTGGAPLTTDDYDAQNQLLQALIYSSMNSTKHLTEWDTLNIPQMAANTYVQHGGALFLGDSNTSISGTPSNGRVYVKVVRSGNSLTFSFVNSSSGYSWNDTYCGFYHADDSQLLPYILYKTASGYEKFTMSCSVDKHDITSTIIVKREISIGSWDMNTDPWNTYLHNSNDWTRIRDVHILISNDSGIEKSNIFRGGHFSIGSTTIRIDRDTMGYFDSTDFNDTGVDRGIITFNEYI